MYDVCLQMYLYSKVKFFFNVFEFQMQQPINFEQLDVINKCDISFCNTLQGH